jgi:hypothetical protein
MMDKVQKPSKSEYLFKVYVMMLSVTQIHSLMELSPSWEVANCAATQNFPAFYGTRRFITVFIGPYPESDQSNPYHPILSL